MAKTPYPTTPDGWYDLLTGRLTRDELLQLIARLVTDQQSPARGEYIQRKRALELAKAIAEEVAKQHRFILDQAAEVHALVDKWNDEDMRQLMDELRRFRRKGQFKDDRLYEIVHQLLTEQMGFTDARGRPRWTKIKQHLTVIRAGLAEQQRGSVPDKAETALREGYRRWRERQQND